MVMTRFLGGFLVLAIAFGAAAQTPRTAVAALKLNREGAVDAEFEKRHAANLERARQGDVGVLFLGDSITQGWTWGEQQKIWDRYFANYNAANFGISGDRTQH